MLILPAARQHGTETRPCGRVGIAAERETVDIDHLLVRRSIDVAVGSHGRTEIAGPASLRPDRFEKPLDVGGHGRWRLARQHSLEMLARQIVVAFEIERPRQLKPHPHQSRPVDENRVERGDRLVEKRSSFRLGGVGSLRCTQCSQTDEKQYVRSIRMRRC